MMTHRSGWQVWRHKSFVAWRGQFLRPNNFCLLWLRGLSALPFPSFQLRLGLLKLRLQHSKRTISYLQNRLSSSSRKHFRWRRCLARHNWKIKKILDSLVLFPFPFPRRLCCKIVTARVLSIKKISKRPPSFGCIFVDESLCDCCCWQRSTEWASLSAKNPYGSTWCNVRTLKLSSRFSCGKVQGSGG